MTSAVVISFDDSDRQGDKVRQSERGTKLKLGIGKPQAPEGSHTAKCVHVEPNWTYLWNRKVALYFEIVDGPHTGTVARRFYPLKKLSDGTYEIAPKSKLMRDIAELFPDKLEKGEVDPVELFDNKFFNIDVIQKKSKKGEVNSIVSTLTHYEPCF